MRIEDAKQMKVGDIVITKVGKNYVPVEVMSVQVLSRYGGPGVGQVSDVRFWLMPKGAPKTDRLGNPVSPRYTRWSSDVGKASDTECVKDVVKANVYADWLEENGHKDAAEALRGAFPLSRSQY